MILAIIQARMGSTRLPGKVLRPLLGEPMLAHVVTRTARARKVDEVIVATSTEVADDPIVGLCATRGWTCFRGSENDVLDRYHAAAQQSDATAIVRITADCPLIDPQVIDDLLISFEASSADYACNFHPRRTFPRGLDCEVFTRDTLERCWRNATDPSSREHVTAFIYRNPETFVLHSIEADMDYSSNRWTVDTPEDFAVVEAIYAHYRHNQFTWIDALDACRSHPAWGELNAHIEQKAH
jgi:spore coat polysaccharide biosynthesis protein SpsF